MKITTMQKEQILELRNQGYGYARIAALMNISQNSVKSYLQRANKKRQEAGKEVCLECRKPMKIAPGTRKKRFCSDACRNAWWNKRPELVNRKAFYDYVCPWCGKKFTAYGNDHRVYCSRGCYAEARRKDNDRVGISQPSAV